MVKLRDFRKDGDCILVQDTYDRAYDTIQSEAAFSTHTKVYARTRIAEIVSERGAACPVDLSDAASKIVHRIIHVLMHDKQELISRYDAVKNIAQQQIPNLTWEDADFFKSLPENVKAYVQGDTANVISVYINDPYDKLIFAICKDDNLARMFHPWLGKNNELEPIHVMMAIKGMKDRVSTVSNISKYIADSMRTVVRTTSKDVMQNMLSKLLVHVFYVDGANVDETRKTRDSKIFRESNVIYRLTTQGQYVMEESFVLANAYNVTDWLGVRNNSNKYIGDALRNRAIVELRSYTHDNIARDYELHIYKAAYYYANDENSPDWIVPAYVILLDKTCRYLKNTPDAYEKYLESEDFSFSVIESAARKILEFYTPRSTD